MKWSDITPEQRAEAQKWLDENPDAARHRYARVYTKYPAGGHRIETKPDGVTCIGECEDHSGRITYFYRCKRRAVVDGKWCRTHDPVARYLKQRERDAAFWGKMHADREAATRASVEQAKRERIVDAFPVLREAMERIANGISAPRDVAVDALARVNEILGA